ncbi:MAG: hypothetical protein ACLRTA_05140, partial [Clostridia bacterium]
RCRYLHFPLSFEEEVHHHGAILIDMKVRRSIEMVEDILDGFYKKAPGILPTSYFLSECL